MGADASLAEFEEKEEEDPEGSHNVPVPDGGVDYYLTGGKRARELQGRQSDDKSDDAKEEMHGMGDGDEIEEVATWIGAEEDVLCGELVPCDPLAGEEEHAEQEREREPEGGAL